MGETTAARTAPPEFPQSRTCPFQPPKGYAPLREGGPLSRVSLWDGRVVWLITGYTEGRDLLADRRLSADRTRPDYPIIAPRFAADVTRRLVLIGMDPPAHDVHRRLLNPAFSLRQARELAPRIQRTVDDAVDEVLRLGPPVDLVEHLALPVPSEVVSELLGVPYADHGFFQDATRRLMQARDEASSQTAGRDLVDYLERLVAVKRRRPDNGLITRLIESLEVNSLSHEELVQIALVILVAGHETTASMIALGVITLLEHPDQLRALTADAASVRMGVEELLRYLAVTDLAGTRVATEDIEIGGEVIHAGDGVLVSSTLGNRDGSVHADPDVLDVGRGDRRHLTFGYGIHQCLGQNLARVELEIVFETLFRRIPGLRLAVPMAELPTRPPGVGTIQGVTALPVMW
ncbi:cytochrome P450 [Saccharothrix obliqua]|uniref:cytochrome P450 n=1 Tax=Saccharothrix obliqua TaxID=2861747 RepID=UPI001C5FD702|nr:cytochrome P450 [Saccharothrix obliqua]MBW4717867.1 cytochrome P450 [Saccharothrix obliqua]